jgi:hypothetical protein
MKPGQRPKVSSMLVAQASSLKGQERSFSLSLPLIFNKDKKERQRVREKERFILTFD